MTTAPQEKRVMRINNDLRYGYCPLCTSERVVKVGNIDYNSPLIFSTEEISLEKNPELWTCNICDSAFTQNVIPEQIATTLYGRGIGAERWIPKLIEDTKHHEIVEILDELFHKNVKVLDIGCNTGELLDYAKSKGCLTSGVEFCKTSREIIEQKGHEAFSSVSDISACYDIITGFDLVEHLYDVPGFLHFCRQKLTDRGRIVLLTGDIRSLSARLAGSNWWYVKYPEHIVFPSKKYFAEFSGLQLERWIRTYASRSFEYPLWSSLASIIYGLLKGSYTALPSLGSDHILLVLKK